MERNEIRIGRVSSVNKNDGTCRVVYKDKNNSVTMELPLFSFTGEYKPPEIDSLVMVIHLSNGSAAGIVMGGFWYRDMRPPDPDAVWRKDIDDDAYFSYKNGTLTIKADKIRLVTTENDEDLDDLIEQIGSGGGTEQTENTEQEGTT